MSRDCRARRRPLLSLAAIGFALGLGLAQPAPTVAADASAYAAKLTAQDKKDIAEMERYLNKIHSMKARFVQITDDGRYSEGKLLMERPDKIRFEYSPPIPVLIVASYGWVTYYDSKLEQVSKVPLDSTPLWLLAREEIKFSGKVTVTGVERSAGVIRLGLVQTEDPEAGHVILTFSRAPMELRKWTITDPQGVTINVALFNMEKNVDIDEELFVFRDPRKGSFN